jgi:hypothetical protein
MNNKEKSQPLPLPLQRQGLFSRSSGRFSVRLGKKSQHVYSMQRTEGKRAARPCLKNVYSPPDGLAFEVLDQ